MSKRPGDIIISTPGSKVRRRLNFDSPYRNRATAPTVHVTNRKRAWMNRPMYRKPMMYRMYRSPDIPRGCEGPCKVQSFEQRDDVKHLGICKVISDVTRGPGLTHRVGKRFVSSPFTFLVRSGWMKILRSRITLIMCCFTCLGIEGLYGNTPQDFGQIFNMFDNEPSTATIKNDLRDRFQVLRKFHATVIGGPSGMKEQALVKRFYRLNHHVTYNHQEAGKYENHTENALLLYMACTHASNPVYATLKIRIYFYDSVGN
uniref:Capsid protein n=1 Tax=Begomovirus manihotis TaxID=10817 RepID=F6J0W3_9GEMI|nr:coat protein [African cassava mosaic virus]